MDIIAVRKENEKLKYANETFMELKEFIRKLGHDPDNFGWDTTRNLKNKMRELANGVPDCEKRIEQVVEALQGIKKVFFSEKKHDKSSHVW